MKRNASRRIVSYENRAVNKAKYRREMLAVNEENKQTSKKSRHDEGKINRRRRGYRKWRLSISSIK